MAASIAPRRSLHRLSARCWRLSARKARKAQYSSAECRQPSSVWPSRPSSASRTPRSCQCSSKADSTSVDTASAAHSALCSSRCNTTRAEGADTAEALAEGTANRREEVGENVGHVVDGARSARGERDGDGDGEHADRGDAISSDVAAWAHRPEPSERIQSARPCGRRAAEGAEAGAPSAGHRCASAIAPMRSSRARVKRSSSSAERTPRSNSLPSLSSSSWGRRGGGRTSSSSACRSRQRRTARASLSVLGCASSQSTRARAFLRSLVRRRIARSVTARSRPAAICSSPSSCTREARQDGGNRDARKGARSGDSDGDVGALCRGSGSGGAPLR